MPSSLNSGASHFAVTFRNPSAAFGTDTAIFVAPYACALVSASEVHAVLGTNGSAVNAQLTHDTGTDAPGAGTDLLSNNSAAGFDLKGTINTVQYAAWKAGTSRRFAKGDRLSVDFAGTQTSVDGICITAIFNRLG